MEKIRGYIDHIIFRNEENGYTVLVLSLEGKEELTCVGSLAAAAVGSTIEAEGEYISHSIYGRQFQISRMEEVIPQDEDGIERYLGSGAIKGIGSALAARIVRRFGTDSLRIMEEEPQRLAEIKGISGRMAKEIGEQAAEKTQMRRAMIFLQKYGISLNLGVKIYQFYGEKVYQILQENPYQLAEDIRGVGFLTADEIASRIGIHVDSDYRIRSGMLYILNQAQTEGHIFLSRRDLLAQSERLLNVSASYMDKHLMDLALEQKIILRTDGSLNDENAQRVYPAYLYRLEQSTARKLCELNVKRNADRNIFERRLKEIEKDTGLGLDQMQKEALLRAVENGLFILTGGPGTGKTTTIDAIIRYFELEGAAIELAAPTGRAAKRITETTGRQARTIHRLLELSGMPEDEQADASAIRFERNEQNPLTADVVIIDEMSMVDIWLMHSLLQAVSPGTRLILVGDENQLPSVGPGNVLKDMIKSGEFPVTELRTIFRQASKSDIVVNAHKINRGEDIVFDNRSSDFFFLKRLQADQILRVTIALVRDKLPPYVHAKPYEIQVLTPMRKGVLGVENLNRVLQHCLNPPGEDKNEHETGDHILREGDKVMQIRNNYQMEWELRGRKGVVIESGLGVFNGDMGIIRRISDFSQTVEVEFDEGRTAEYPFRQLDELELAYAVTIHKSQGSEYPAVVLPLLTGPSLLMNRNLLYTAVTRARKCVTVVGSEAAFSQMVHNERQIRRNSSLDESIRALARTHEAS